MGYQVIRQPDGLYAIFSSFVAAHQSRSPALPELTRCLDLRNGREYLRWLVPRP